MSDNEWSQPASPPPPLFTGKKEKDLVKQINDEIEINERELNQNAADFTESKTKLEEETKRYKLVEKLQERELKESLNATKVIRIKK